MKQKRLGRQRTQSVGGEVAAVIETGTWSLSLLSLPVPKLPGTPPPRMGLFPAMRPLWPWVRRKRRRERGELGQKSGRKEAHAEAG